MKEVNARTAATSHSKRAVSFVRARTVPHNGETLRWLLQQQVLYCREVADKLGATLTHEYGVEGGTTDPMVKKTIEELLRAVEEQRIDYVIAQGWDRLTRQPAEAAKIADRLKAAGTRFVTDPDLSADSSAKPAKGEVK